jgi:hypothetical protein
MDTNNKPDPVEALRCEGWFGVWQSIETAPRDETEVLIKTSIGVVSAWFHSEPGEYYQWVCYDDAFTIDGDCGSVTHWMPLPPSPNVQR